MTSPTRVARPAAALLLALVSALATSTIVFADSGSGPHLDSMPLTFAAGVRMLQDERLAIDSSRAAGDFDDLARRAGRLTVIVGAVRSLAQEPRGAMDAPALVEVSRAADSILAVAAELLDAASRRDLRRIEHAASRLAPYDSLLDAHVVKQYVCPMQCKPGVTYDRPGTCPVCGMHLKLVTNDRYSVEVTPTPARIRAGHPTTLSFHIKDPFGLYVTNLEVVHEKLIHLMVASNDLSWFEHVHPVLDGPGRFSLRITSRPAARTPCSTTSRLRTSACRSCPWS